jgi:hypothetical protein
MSGCHGRAAAALLGGSPEIAVLEGLGHTLRIAIAVTRALNPELAAPWGGVCPLRVKAASRVLTHAESLLCALACYRDAVDCEGRRPLDDDLPF